MRNTLKSYCNLDYALIGRYAVWIAILLGVILRIVVFLQCNGMYVDEANIARNVFERGYAGLLCPLNYEQYAPPVFLWLTKSSTIVFGLSEYGFRLYPLICGLLSLFFMYAVLKCYVKGTSIWYVLLLLAVGPIYVRYAVAAKQYVPDMFIGLIIVWLALLNRVEKKSGIRLFVLWTLVGSAAIWSSMPSVFILAGVGCFYMSDIFKYRYFDKIWFLLGAGSIWLVQFALYYFIILKPQANSDYLQNFHKEYFFYFPTNLKILQKDIDLFLSLFANVGGHQVLSMILNIGCIIVGAVYLFRRDLSKLVLLIVPLIALMSAAMMHQYSLIPRLTLFAMPLLLVLISIGFQKLLENKFFVFRFAIVTCAVICFINFNALRYFAQPMQEEEIKQSLTFLMKEGIDGQQLYVQNLAWPGYKYYTDIHPNKGAILTLRGAHILNWDANWDSLSRTFPARMAVIYCWDESDKINMENAFKGEDILPTDSNKVKGSSAYIYTRNQGMQTK